MRGLRVVTDPYTSGALGLHYDPIEEEADIVTVSHDHADHNCIASVKGNPDVVSGSGKHTARGVEFRGIQCYHDDCTESQRGANTVFCFSLDGIEICHLGDLGHDLAPELEVGIGPVDLLLIPVGGNFTIDHNIAASICRRLNPKVVIPMHFRNERCLDFPVAGVEGFLALMQTVRQEESNEARFDKDSLPQTTEVVVLKPAL